MTKWDMLMIRAYVLWYDLKMFFRYTLWGKKTPQQKISEMDPFLYEDDQ